LDTLQDKTLAAVDLGSNSFHLGLAVWENGKLEIKTRLREKIQLAAGLNQEKELSQEAQDRALACLATFGDLIRDLPPQQVRVVGTNTFREARNLNGFLTQVHQVLGHPVEIISGKEEARLIYLGVTQSRGIPPQRLLVIDIGGGSTEIIIGEKGKPEWLQSIPIGCVSFTKRFFNDLKNDAVSFTRALHAAKEAFAAVKTEVAKVGWEIVWGTSGTIDAVDSVLKTNGWDIDGITPAGLRALQQALLVFMKTSDIELPGLRADRATIFPAGVAILTAAFESFGIENMTAAGAALREGLLFEMVERLKGNN
jgi:exopolyphosphatase/guanosine-5'-triphosphate,3'-diphosphate pyrophosphatase